MEQGPGNGTSGGGLRDYRGPAALEDFAVSTVPRRVNANLN